MVHFLKVVTISRVVMPLAYRDKIWLSICLIRLWFFFNKLQLKAAFVDARRGDFDLTIITEQRF